MFLTFPTAGSHLELMNSLISDSGLPLENIVVVVTRKGVELPSGIGVIEDLASPNIQRWWNIGIDECVRRGATEVAVVNDDISLNEESLRRLGEALLSTGATVASPSRPPSRDGVYRKRLVPYSPRLWGCFWVLDATSTLRPDEDFVWWYGDSDLDIRARRDHAGVVNVNVFYEHHFPGQGTIRNSELQEQSNLDAVTYQRKYARMLTLTTYVNRIGKILGREWPGLQG